MIDTSIAPTGLTQENAKKILLTCWLTVNTAVIFVEVSTVTCMRTNELCLNRYILKLNVMPLFNLFFLSGANVAECQDQDEKCSSLARKGDCLKNAEYMLVKCRKSCFMCGGRK